jgi:hypothetical protein
MILKRATSLELTEQGMKSVVCLQTPTVLIVWLLNVHGVSNVRQTEIHTAEPLVPEPSAFEVEMAIEKIKGHKSPGTDQIPAELIKAGCRTIRSEIHKRINCILNGEELPEECKE